MRIGSHWANMTDEKKPENGVGSVKIWGSIPMEGCTDLHIMANSTVTAIKYKDEILRVIFLCWCKASWFPAGTGQCLIVGSSWMMKTIDCPSHFPDLNPTDYPWDIMCWCIQSTVTNCPDPGLGGDPSRHHPPTHQGGSRCHWFKFINSVFRVILNQAYDRLLIFVSTNSDCIIFSTNYTMSRGGNWEPVLAENQFPVVQFLRIVCLLA